jgi:hypothetical protein
MAKIDLDSMSIEELAKLRENINAKIIEKVAARQLEMERLSEYGKSAKKSPAAPPAKAKKTEQKKSEEPAGQEPPVAEAA